MESFILEFLKEQLQCELCLSIVLSETILYKLLYLKRKKTLNLHNIN